MFRAEVKHKHLHLDYDSMVAANEVFKDRETGSRWQQSTGEAISGPLKGTQLTIYPFLRTTWGEWRKQHPGTLVLQPLPGYADNMAGMSRLIALAKLGEGEAPKGAEGRDDRLRPRETVAGLRIGAETVAFPFSELRKARVVNYSLAGVPVLVVHQPSSDTTTAFEARAKRKVLRFEAADADASTLVDLETHSSWNAYGLCLSGALRGARLKPLVLEPEFWFAWSEFHPRTKVFTAVRPVGGAQSGAAKPAWEILMRAPLPEDAEPKLSVFSLPLGPAPAVPRAMGPGHRHAGPVFAYILQGEIENEVEPDPARIYKSGDFFYEAPMHLHKFMRNLSQTEPAKLIVFQAGNTGQRAPVIKLLLEQAIASTMNKELGLLRLTLPPGTASEARPHSGPGIVYVLEGSVENSGSKLYAAGDLFVEPGGSGSTFRNASENEPAKLLLYQVNENPVSEQTAR